MDGDVGEDRGRGPKVFLLSFRNGNMSLHIFLAVSTQKNRGMVQDCMITWGLTGKLTGGNTTYS